MKNLFCILCILFTRQRGFSTNNVLENEYYKLILTLIRGVILLLIRYIKRYAWKMLITN